MAFEDIIVKVKKHPELWLGSHPYYKNRAICKGTWEEIATEIGVDEWIIKKRWKHLKDQYRKELKKILSKQIPLSSWQYYNDLSFITDEVLTGKRGINKSVDVIDLPSDNESDSDEPLAKRRAKKPPENELPNTSDVNDGIKSTLIKEIRELKGIVESRNKPIEDDLRNDADYLFLVSLLPSIRKLSDIQKLSFRGKINEWLLEILTQYELAEQCDNKIYIHSQINESQRRD